MIKFTDFDGMTKAELKEQIRERDLIINQYKEICRTLKRLDQQNIDLWAMYSICQPDDDNEQ